MRATWTAVVLTATLGLAPVATASVTVANAADTAAATNFRPFASIVPPIPIPVEPPVGLPVTPPGTALPAVGDPTKSLEVLGGLGDVLGLVTKLVGSATSVPPDPAALQKLLTDLQDAVKALVAKLPAPPVPVPVPGVPVDEARIVPPLPTNPADALDKVQKAAADLVAKATATTPDPAAIKDAVPPLSTNTVTATVATATALVTG